MAIAYLDGVRVYYRLEGAAGRPVVALSHALGLDHTMWDPQIPALTAQLRVLRYDLRGHGGSDATPGDYTVERLGRDALALLDRLRLDRVSWCGGSLGGMVGQWLAAHAGDRLSDLILANTSPRIADPPGMEARRRAVLDGGTRAIVDTAMPRFFGDALVGANPPRIASARETFLATDPVGYAGCCAALRDFDGTELLSLITARTLVVSGDADVSMPWEAHGAVLAAAMPNATVVRLATAHASNLVLPRTFTRTLLEFLSSDPRDAFEAGLDIRRAVLGDDYVAARIATTTDLTHDYQRWITQFAWGGIWTRPGLDLHTRRLIVLAIAAALGRWEEFRLHLEAGLAADVEWADVEEVLLQTGVYAGVPAANTAFTIASEVRGRQQEKRPTSGSA
ncbi:3-oxoadipate enol-lactonase 2 [Luteitalea pratensis]|uniref:3-oxoadipate enol-lactonase 2 n=1 Tax=Luteitalea pratensis TaxID=1855912 RepID=A0A143PSF3_LUTPR|nr:alpha/beta fold hydrolase [Luteitalea pratensis]AMY10769.1 3-oxoadipate enol-lactonase 2 [Luteitalea pratensis]